MEIITSHEYFELCTYVNKITNRTNNITFLNDTINVKTEDLTFNNDEHTTNINKSINEIKNCINKKTAMTHFFNLLENKLIHDTGFKMEHDVVPIMTMAILDIYEKLEVVVSIDTDDLKTDLENFKVKFSDLLQTLFTDLSNSKYTLDANMLYEYVNWLSLYLASFNYPNLFQPLLNNIDHATINNEINIAALHELLNKHNGDGVSIMTKCVTDKNILLFLHKKFGMDNVWKLFLESFTSDVTVAKICSNFSGILGVFDSANFTENDVKCITNAMSTFTDSKGRNMFHYMMCNSLNDATSMLVMKLFDPNKKIVNKLDNVNIHPLSMRNIEQNCPFIGALISDKYITADDLFLNGNGLHFFISSDCYNLIINDIICNDCSNYIEYIIKYVEISINIAIYNSDITKNNNIGIEYRYIENILAKISKECEKRNIDADELYLQQVKLHKLPKSYPLFACLCALGVNAISLACNIKISKIMYKYPFLYKYIGVCDHGGRNILHITRNVCTTLLKNIADNTDRTKLNNNYQYFLLYVASYYSDDDIYCEVFKSANNNTCSATSLMVRYIENKEINICDLTKHNCVVLKFLVAMAVNSFSDELIIKWCSCDTIFVEMMRIMIDIAKVTPDKDLEQRTSNILNLLNILFTCNEKLFVTTYIGRDQWFVWDICDNKYYYTADIIIFNKKIVNSVHYTKVDLLSGFDNDIHTNDKCDMFVHLMNSAELTEFLLTSGLVDNFYATHKTFIDGIKFLDSYDIARSILCVPDCDYEHLITAINNALLNYNNNDDNYGIATMLELFNHLYSQSNEIFIIDNGKSQCELTVFTKMFMTDVIKPFILPQGTSTNVIEYSKLLTLLITRNIYTKKNVTNYSKSLVKIIQLQSNHLKDIIVPCIYFPKTDVSFLMCDNTFNIFVNNALKNNNSIDMAAFDKISEFWDLNISESFDNSTLKELLMHDGFIFPDLHATQFIELFKHYANDIFSNAFINCIASKNLLFMIKHKCASIQHARSILAIRNELDVDMYEKILDSYNIIELVNGNFDVTNTVFIPLSQRDNAEMLCVYLDNCADHESTHKILDVIVKLSDNHQYYFSNCAFATFIKLNRLDDLNKHIHNIVTSKKQPAWHTSSLLSDYILQCIKQNHDIHERSAIINMCPHLLTRFNKDMFDDIVQNTQFDILLKFLAITSNSFFCIDDATYIKYVKRMLTHISNVLLNEQLRAALVNLSSYSDFIELNFGRISLVAKQYPDVIMKIIQFDKCPANIKTLLISSENDMDDFAIINASYDCLTDDIAKLFIDSLTSETFTSKNKRGKYKIAYFLNDPYMKYILNRSELHTLLKDGTFGKMIFSNILNKNTYDSIYKTIDSYPVNITQNTEIINAKGNTFYMELVELLNNYDDVEIDVIINILKNECSDEILLQTNYEGNNILFLATKHKALFLSILSMYVEKYGFDCLESTNNANETLLMKCLKDTPKMFNKLRKMEMFKSSQNYVHKTCGSLIIYAVLYSNNNDILNYVLRWDKLSTPSTNNTYNASVYDWHNSKYIDAHCTAGILAAIQDHEYLSALITKFPDIINDKVTIDNKLYNLIEIAYMNNPESFQYLITLDNLSETFFTQTNVDRFAYYSKMQPASWYIFLTSKYFVETTYTKVFRKLPSCVHLSSITSAYTKSYVQITNIPCDDEHSSCNICMKYKANILYGCLQHTSCISCAVQSESCPSCRNSDNRIKLFN
jgi:hypothetical protein